LKPHSIAKFSQYLAATITIIFLAGGGCYELPKTYDSKDFSADLMLSTYILEERDRQTEKSCYLTIDAPNFIINSLKRIQLTPPAQVTFQGKSIALDRSTKVSCQNQSVEFVLTDNRGGKKIEKFDLRRGKTETKRISTDRSTDLRIPILELPYPQDTNFQLLVKTAKGEPYLNAKQEPYIVEVTNISKKYPNEIPTDFRPIFDRDLQTLIIPKQVLAELKGKAVKFNLTATVMLFTKYPDDVGSFNSFKHTSDLDPIAIEFK
jgi:hypothetical protein